MAKRRMLKVNFKDVESGGRVRVPEADYHLKCVANKQDESKDGNPMIVWDFEIVEGKHKGKKLRDYAPLSTKGLWKLKSILEAFGVTVPNRAVNINLDKYIGEELGATVQDDEYGGRISSKISDYFSLDVLDADDDEEEDDEDLEEEEDDEEEEDEEEDEEEEDEEPEPPKRRKRGAKAGKKGKKASSDDEDDEEIEEIDLDEL